MLRRDRLDLVQDVAGDEHALALGAEPRMMSDQVAAGDRVGAGQRLVEEQHLRVVDEGLGELGPLPHPLGVAADRPGRRARSCRPRRAPGRPPRAPSRREKPPSRAQVVDELRGRSSTRRRRPARGRGRCSGSARGLFQARWPRTRTSPWLGRSWPVASCRSVLLPAPLGPSRPVTPGRDAERQLVQADDVAVPLRDAAELDDRRQAGSCWGSSPEPVQRLDAGGEDPGREHEQARRARRPTRSRGVGRARASAAGRRRSRSAGARRRGRRGRRPAATGGTAPAATAAASARLAARAPRGRGTSRGPTRRRAAPRAAGRGWPCTRPAGTTSASDRLGRTSAATLLTIQRPTQIAADQPRVPRQRRDRQHQRPRRDHDRPAVGDRPEQEPPGVADHAEVEAERRRPSTYASDRRHDHHRGEEHARSRRACPAK